LEKVLAATRGLFLWLPQNIIYLERPPQQAFFAEFDVNKKGQTTSDLFKNIKPVLLS